jgi:hypothetical protein
MRRFLICFLVVLCFKAKPAGAGNSNGIGESGAPELLIDPWARSAGWNWINSACIGGIEAMKLNVAGLAATQGTEVDLCHTLWLDGSGISINTLGISQNLGKSGGVLGIDIMSMSFGDITTTTTQNPDGGIGTFSPQFINFGLGYAKVFSNNIFAGLAVRGVSEAISNVSALGVEADAGVQYQTGPESEPDRIKFGISLRNIGTKMTFSGGGLAYENTVNTALPYDINFNMQADAFNMPSLLNIGASYDFKWGGANDNKTNRLTIAANFASHSYSQDQGGLGAEYAFKEIFMIRAGYNYEGGITEASTRNTVLTGLCAGLSVVIPLKKKGPQLEIDYAYQTTSPFNGVDSFGLRLTM